MDAVKKAASGAVDSIRNSPLFKRKFGNRTPSQSPTSGRRPAEAISPEKDTTPFVQGVYFMVDYLGKQAVDSGGAQEHGCTDEAVAMLWKSSRDSPVARRVSIKVTTTCIRVKEISGRDDSSITTDEVSVAKIFYEFPLFRVSYCGTSDDLKEAFSFVAKDQDGKYYCYVFRCASKEKSHAITLTVAKAFYLAYQILLEQQGNFPSGPDREVLFEPQRPDDTHEHPQRPDISTSDKTYTQQVQLEVADDTASPSEATPITTHIPSLRVMRPSQTSEESESLTLASADEDFTRLAKARSNPDILRSTLDAEDIKGGQLGWAEKLRLHADPGSTMHTPIGSMEQLDKVGSGSDSS